MLRPSRVFAAQSASNVQPITQPTRSQNPLIIQGMPVATPSNDVEIRATLSSPRSSACIAAPSGDAVKAVELCGPHGRFVILRFCSR